MRRSRRVKWGQKWIRAHVLIRHQEDSRETDYFIPSTTLLESWLCVWKKMSIGLSLTPHMDIYLKSVTDISIKWKECDFWKSNRKSFQRRKQSRSGSGQTHIKRGNNKSDFRNIKICEPWKDGLKEMERLASAWEKSLMHKYLICLRYWRSVLEHQPTNGWSARSWWVGRKVIIKDTVYRREVRQRKKSLPPLPVSLAPSFSLKKTLVLRYEYYACMYVCAPHAYLVSCCPQRP